MARTLNLQELELISKFLEMSSEEFSNHGCNEMTLENTDSNWQFVVEMEKWNRTPIEDMPVRPAKNKPIYTSDWFVMSYLSHRAKEQTE